MAQATATGRGGAAPRRGPGDAGAPPGDERRTPADRRTPSRFALEGLPGPLEPRGGGTEGTLADRLDGRNPVVGALVVGLAAYLGLLVLLAGLGTLLDRVFLDGPVGRWDLDAVRWFADRRREPWDSITRVGSGFANTPVVIIVGSVVASIALVKRWAQGAVLLAVALFTEVAVFLSTVLLVPRDRPDVPKLDAVPPTSSFPSGHTAASIALYGSLAVIACAFVRSGAARRAVVAVLGLVPVFVGLSRVYRGMHHPTDVLAGVLLGVGALLAGLLAARTALLLARDRATAGGSPAKEEVGR